MVLVRDGNRTVISMLNDYKGPLSEFALIVPTPTALQKGQVRVAEKAIFERLDAYSAPRLAEYHDNDPCQLNFHWGQAWWSKAEMLGTTALPAPADGASISKRSNSSLGVTVEASYTLEEYDIVSLSATQSDGLETWLRENGYSIPKGASAALKPYINLGMKFFVAKVNLKQQLKTGYSYLRPLQFAFESEKFMLPMRLGMLNAAPGQAQDLIVYALTKNGRVESSNYRTTKLPSNMNLPPFIKAKFGEFYKDMFEQSAKKEDFKTVLTEYFWDMGWCDPCAANPLSTEELRKAGVFWVGGNADEVFSNMKAPNAGDAPMKIRMPLGGGTQPAMLTRLHIRYTPESLSEDLMFNQTADRQNWQARYVLQQPFAGSVSACSAKVGKADCTAMCKQRIQDFVREPQRIPGTNITSKVNENELMSDCITACKTSKTNALDAVKQYYTRQLPERERAERKTLAQLTGWSDAEISKMGGTPIDADTPPSDSAPQKQNHPKKWWEQLFGLFSPNQYLGSKA